MHAEAERAVYLYCLARPVGQAFLSAAADTNVGCPMGGLERIATQALPAPPPSRDDMGDIVAVFSWIPLAEFAGADAEDRLRDADWVVPRACRHQDVIATVMRGSPVLPVRFGTVFASLQTLTNFVAARWAALSAYLNDIADKEEWAVKLFVDEGRAGSWLATTDPALAQRSRELSTRPGTRYFQEKRLQADIQKQVQLWSRPLVRQVMVDLRDFALDSCPLEIGKSSGAVCNAAYLVSKNRAPEFRARVQHLHDTMDERGIRLMSSGPWPPYNFCPSMEKPAS